METFKDRAGRDWSIDVNTDSIERLRGHALAIDLLECAVPEKAEAFYSRLADPITLTRILAVLIGPEQFARALGPGKDPATHGREFGQAMGGDALDDGAEALERALYDFFRKAQRPRLKAAAGKIKEIEAKVEARQMAILTSPRVEQMIERMLDQGEAAAVEQLDQLRPRTSGA